MSARRSIAWYRSNPECDQCALPTGPAGACAGWLQGTRRIAYQQRMARTGITVFARFSRSAIERDLPCRWPLRGGPERALPGWLARFDAVRVANEPAFNPRTRGKGP